MNLSVFRWEVSNITGIVADLSHVSIWTYITINIGSVYFVMLNTYIILGRDIRIDFSSVEGGFLHSDIDGLSFWTETSSISKCHAVCLVFRQRGSDGFPSPEDSDWDENKDVVHMFIYQNRERPTALR